MSVGLAAVENAVATLLGLAVGVTALANVQVLPVPIEEYEYRHGKEGLGAALVSTLRRTPRDPKSGIGGGDIEWDSNVAFVVECMHKSRVQTDRHTGAIAIADAVHAALDGSNITLSGITTTIYPAGDSVSSLAGIARVSCAFEVTFTDSN